MRKFTLGLICGMVFATSIVYAEDAKKSVEAFLFPVKLSFNGEQKEVEKKYEVLQYKGYTYAPVRFIAENMGGTVTYDSKNKMISINRQEIKDRSKLTFKDIVKADIGKVSCYLDVGNTYSTQQKDVINSYMEAMQSVTYTEIPTPEYRSDIILIGGTTTFLYGRDNKEIANIYFEADNVVRINNKFYKMDKDAEKELGSFYKAILTEKNIVKKK